MTLYQRRQDPVLAFQYAGQPKAKWPSWVLDYRVHGAYGEQPIHENLGTLMVPTLGISIAVNRGDWIALEGAELDQDDGATGGVVGVYKAGDFEQAFEEAPRSEGGLNVAEPETGEPEGAAAEEA